MTATSYVSTDLTFVWGMLAFTVFVTYIIQKMKWSATVPPPCAALLLGILFGFLARISGIENEDMRFSASGFFYGLLPPIVLAAGANLNKKDFFENFGAINLFAIIGTVNSTVIFGGFTYLLMKCGIVAKDHIGSVRNCFMYGALISAIDPVATISVFADVRPPPLLYNLVFGESVLNDAVAVVLFRTLETGSTSFELTTIPVLAYNFAVIFLGSLILGVGISVLCAALLKRFRLSNDTDTSTVDGTVLEITLIIIFAYLAYLITEALEFSGIVALFFAGICHSHYSLHNVCDDAAIATHKLFDVAAFLCETFVFAYLGLQVATFKHVFDWGLLLSGIPLCLISRAGNIFPLAWMANKYRTVQIPSNMQWMQLLVGLRGAVSYSLAVNMPDYQPALETATLMIAVFTTLVFGGGTAKMLNVLGLTATPAECPGHRDNIRSVVGFDNLGEVETQSTAPKSTFLETWERLDDNVLRPIFGGHVRGIELIETTEDHLWPREEVPAYENPRYEHVMEPSAGTSASASGSGPRAGGGEVVRSRSAANMQPQP